MKSVWQRLSKPIFSLAPMEGVTDSVFRQILCTTGKPDVFFTEFTNVDGLASAGHDSIARRLFYSEIEHPIIAQIWGLIPENFYKVSRELVKMGFDGIDINMGCPQHDVIRYGACSALIKNHQLAKEIIEATKEGTNNKLPVSVKTRIGYKAIQTEEWIGFLLEQKLALVIVHGRTVAEMSKVPAHWDEIGKTVMLRDKINKDTLIFGNGDIMDLEDAKQKVREYDVDGVMIGRGIFHNPWFFKGINPTTKKLKDRIQLLQKHVLLYQKMWDDKKSYQILKKYFKIYLSDFEGASDLRIQFMTTNSYQEALLLVEKLMI